jgi:hypothetical protein
MDNETEEVRTTKVQTPAEMLARQVELLEAIHQSLDRQERVAMHLAQQQEVQAEQLRHLSEDLLPDAEAHPGRQWVKVQDINVPFLNLSMFLVKLALAGIPAGIVLWVIVFVIVALFGLLGLSVFSLFGF